MDPNLREACERWFQTGELDQNNHDSGDKRDCFKKFCRILFLD